MERIGRMRRNCFGFVAIFMFCAISGCSPQATIVDDSTQIQVPSSDNLDVTIDYLFSEDQFAMSEIEEKVSGGLSRWIFAEKDKIDQFEWHHDPLLETVPAEVKPLVDELNRENFKTMDSHYLQGQIRFKSLGESITARPVVRKSPVRSLGTKPVSNGRKTAPSRPASTTRIR